MPPRKRDLAYEYDSWFGKGDKWRLAGAASALRHSTPAQVLRIKRSLDDGEKLAIGDLTFLHEVLKTAGQIKPLMDRNPDFQDFYAQSVSLFHEITTLALENEQRP